MSWTLNNSIWKTGLDTTLPLSYMKDNVKIKGFVGLKSLILDLCGQVWHFWIAFTNTHFLVFAGQGYLHPLRKQGHKAIWFKPFVGWKP